MQETCPQRTIYKEAAGFKSRLLSGGGGRKGFPTNLSSSTGPFVPSEKPESRVITWATKGG